MKMDPENDENLVKITDICRACLSRTETMKFLLEDSEEILSLLSKFVTVSNLEIEIGFKYPSYLCTICEEKILSSYEFQQQCQKSNDLIKEYLEVFLKQDTIPSEPESKITLTNLNTSEERNISLELHNTTDTVQLIYEEISNPPYEDSKEYKDEYDEKFQEDLSQAILNLKEKYMGDNECVVCQYQAENHTTLSTHVSTKHKKSKDSWCSICNKIFSNIITHLEEHKNDFVCKFCHIKFSSFESIIDHLYKYQAIQKNEYTQKIDSQDVPKAGSKVLICQFCNKPFYTDSELKKHLCNRGKRKENRDLVGEIETPNNTSQEEEKYNTLLEEEIIIKADSLPDEFKNFTPVEVPLKNKTLQKMRLKQYSVEDVSKAISIFKGKFYKHVNCIFCNFTAVTNRSLSVHVTRVHSEYKNKWCSSCNKVTDNQTSHNKEVHFEDLKCPFCRKIKNNMGHFMEHLASHSADRLYKCNKCIKSFISKRHLRIHKATHKSEFKCGVCKQTFKQALHLRVHLKTHQRLDQNSSVIQSDSIEIKVKEEGNESNENDTLNCRSDYDETKDEAKKPQNYCKDCNKKVRSLLSHYLQHHNKTKPENADKQNLCPHCGKRFRTSSKLTVHIRTHTGESPYKCRYCDKWVKTRNILIVHERTHTGEKPYMCTICGKSFAQSSVLNTHTRIHTGRPEQCTICEKRFCRPAELRLHMRKHTGEKPYKCQHCGLGFKQKSHLVEHTKTHNDDRPYQCEFCEKAFKNHGTLKCHLQIHSGQKPFKCSQCSYACRQPYSLTQHMVQHDNDKPQLDYPHKCEICQRNFATTAHLTAHYNRFHPDLKVKFSETLEQQPTDNNQIIKSDTINDHEANQSDSNNYQRSQESQIQSSESELVESVGNVDTIIIQTEIQDGGEIKYEPIEIQFSTFQHEL